jgi:hypothetical protein
MTVKDRRSGGCRRDLLRDTPNQREAQAARVPFGPANLVALQKGPARARAGGRA